MSKRPRWPRLPHSLVQAALAGHSTFGLVAAAILYVVCLSGVPSVFTKELKTWETPAAPVTTAVSPERMSQVLEATWRLAAREGAIESVMVFAPEPGQPQLRGRAYGPTIERVWAFPVEGGAVLPVETPATTFVAELHGNLHGGVWGNAFVGLTGVMLLSLVITGLLAHPRVLKDAFRLRRGGSWRLQETDVHNRISVWAVPFHAVIALTGAMLGLSTVIGGMIMLSFAAASAERAEPPAPREPPAQAAAPWPDVAGMARRVEDADPASKVSFILVSNPGQAGQQVFVDVSAPGHLAPGESYGFSADGEAQGPAGLFDGLLGQQLRAAMFSLHYGTFGGEALGGLLIKLVYGLLGAGLCFVISTGVSIWVARRRDQGRPAPIWSRLWIGVAWGQIAALSLAAIAALAGGPAMAVWIVLGLLLAATGFLAVEEARFARAHRLIAAASIAAIPVARWLLNGPDALMTVPVSLVLLLIAAMIALSAWRGAGLPPPGQQA